MYAPLTYSDSSDAAQRERERLILEHLPQVRWVAMRIHERLPDYTELEDLISIGIIGLINAVDNFDASHNAKLKTYAEYRIRGAIMDSLRGQDGIPAHRRTQLREAERKISALEHRLMRTPTEEEIAAELGLSLAEYQQWLNDVRAISIGSLDARTDDNSGSELLNYIADPSGDSPAKTFERAELEALLAQAIDRLPEVEKLVLSLYYKEGQNLREIGEIMNLHLTRIAQLKSQAILRLRAYLSTLWPAGKGD